MFNPKWCLLIFFIKVLIAAISLIHGAPIDLVPMPLNFSSGVEHFMHSSLENSVNENHVESQTEAELIAINEDFEKEITGNETGFQKDLYNTTEENEENISSNTPKQATQEKISEIPDSQIITENPQNTLEQSLVQNQPISEQPTLDITSESVLMATEPKENDSQNTLGQDSPQIQTTSKQPSSQITSESVLNATEPKESDSQNKPENPQNTLGQDSHQIQPTNEQPSLQITSENVLNATEPKESDSQIINENPQNTQDHNLDQNKAKSEQPMQESASESGIKSTEPKDSDSQNKSENPQNTLGQDLPQILTTSELPLSEITSESVLSSTEPKESDSQTKQENSQNTTEPNFSEYLHSIDEQQIAKSEIIQEDSKASYNPQNENHQNNQIDNLQQKSAQIREVTHANNAVNESEKSQQKEISEESTTQTNAEVNSPKEINDSEIINSTNENTQNMSQKETAQLREMKSFPIENENHQLNTNKNLVDMQKINEDISTQAANESAIPTNKSTDREIVNFQNVKENPQNVPVEIQNENINFNSGAPQQIYVEVREIGSEEEDLKNVNSQINKENPQNIPIDLNREQSDAPIDLNKEDINLNGEASQQIYVEVREIPNQEEESQNANYQIKKENTQNVPKDVNQENVNVYETPSQQIYVEVREIGSGEEEMQNSQNVAIDGNSENSMAIIEENKENIEVNDQKENANSSISSPSDNPHNVPINELSAKSNDVETTVKEIINELNGNNNTNTENSQNIDEESMPAQKIAIQEIIKQMDLQNGQVSANTENNTENSKVNQELDESILNGEISAVINLLKEDNETKLENSQIPTEKNENAQNTQINVAAELKSGNEEKPRTVEPFTPPSQENNDSMNSQAVTENVQNPLSLLNNTEMSTTPHFHITEVFTSTPSNDNINSQISTENPKVVENIPTTETSVLNDKNMHVPTVLDNAESFPISTENPQIVETFPLSGHNEAENLTHLTTEAMGDKSKSENNFNFNSQMPTEDLQNAGIYMLLEKSETLPENAQEKSDAMNSQSTTENILDMTNQLKVEANAMDSQVLPTAIEKREEKSLMENIHEESFNDVEKVVDDNKTSPEEDKIAQESVINAQVTTKVDSDDSFENPGFITLTENTDILVNNYQTTTMEADPREMEHLQSSNVVSETAERQVTNAPSMLHDEQTTAKLDDAPSKLDETPISTSTEIPTITEMTSINTKVMEQTTTLPAEQDLQQSAEKNTIGSLQIEESLETTINPLPAAETSTASADEDSTPPATAEPTTNEESESPATPTTDSNSFDRTTTHHQFASLLAETEMNVHKAFETIREWIANGKKLEEATKNPGVIEEMSTTSNPKSNEFTTTDKSEENNTPSLDTTISGLSSSRSAEENSTFAAKNDAEFSDTTTTSVLTTRPPSTESGFLESIKEAIEEASMDIGTTEQVTESTEGPASVETTMQNVEEETTVQPTFARVQLQKEYTSINLANLDDSSEEMSTEKKPIDALDQVESNIKEQLENITANEEGTENPTTPSELLEVETSTQMPLATTTTFQGMVKFIQHEPTTTQRQDTQTELPLTQASFMEEKQQQIESTTVQEMSVPSTTSGEEEISSMTTDITNESVIITTTTTSETDAAPQTTTDVLATTQEMLSTTTDLSETTTDAPATITTTVAEEELTTTTELPEMDTTTLIVTVEPEPRSLPPPKLEYLQSEDGVEVFYGYSIVKHN